MNSARSAFGDALGCRSRPIKPGEPSTGRCDRTASSACNRGPYFDFGQVLRRARLARQLSQSVVCASIDVAVFTWARIEAGRHLPFLTSLARYRHCTGLDVREALVELPERKAARRAVHAPPAD